MQIDKYLHYGLRNRQMLPDAYFSKLTDYSNETKQLNHVSVSFLFLPENFLGEANATSRAANDKTAAIDFLLNKLTREPRSRWPERCDPWSDEFRAHTCSRCARITWSGKGFERTFVWTMVWNLPDQRPLCSGTVWSEVTLVWDGLIRGSFKRTQVWSEADSSAH